jgi:hypothetical protein
VVPSVSPQLMTNSAYPQIGQYGGPYQPTSMAPRFHGSLPSDRISSQNSTDRTKELIAYGVIALVLATFISVPIAVIATDKSGSSVPKKNKQLGYTGPDGGHISAITAVA